MELLDRAGVPRLRMAPPRLIDDTCKVIPVTVTVTGCAVDRSSAGPKGRALVAPGAAACRFALTWPSSGVAYPAALDPSWSSAASMAEARAYHTATKLPGATDRVLVAGGLGAGPGYNVLASAEIYDADTDTWAATESLGTARYTHAATVLGDGATATVLVAGGLDTSGSPTATVESFTGAAFVPRQSMPGAAAGLTLDRVSSAWAIAAGGYRFVSGALRTVADAPVYDQAGDQWLARTLPGGSRGWHASVATPGAVTFLGGERDDGTFGVLSSVERYNGGVDTFTSLPSMPVARTRAGAGIVAADTVFVAAGETTGGAALNRADSAPLPATTPWTQAADVGAGAIRASVTAIDGGAVVAGGYAGSAVLGSTTLYRTLSTARGGATLQVPRYAHAATLLSGRVLLTGGVTTDGNATDSAEYVTDTVCNQGAGAAPIAPSWGAVVTGTHTAATPLTTTLTNTTPGVLTVDVSVRAQGLDGRDVSRPLWSGSVSPNTSVEVAVAPSFFPVQSVASKTVAELVAVITSAPAEPHLVGVRVASPSLAYTFGPTFADVTLHDTDTTGPPVLEGVTSAEDIAARMGTLTEALWTSVGRVWDGAALVDVSTLPPTLDETESAQVFRSYDFPPADAALFDIHWPGYTVSNDDPDGVRLCARLNVHYIDDDRGETETARGHLPAAFARMELFQRVTSTLAVSLWGGAGTSAGCAPRLSAVTVGGDYLLKVESRLHTMWPSVDVDVGQPGIPAGTAYVPRVSVRALRVLSAQAGPLKLSFPADNRFQASAAIGQTVANSAIEVPSGTYPVRMERCADSTACFSRPALKLGDNNDGTHNVQWKFVVAHEFGHAIQSAFNALPSRSGNTTYRADVEDTPAPPSLCKCDHVVDPDDQSHCMQSREYLVGVEPEAYAHAVAASTWNALDENACTFVYYKNTLETPTDPRSPPVPVDCHQKRKWLEDTCLRAARGVEWDWMNWMRAVNTAPLASRSTTGDVADIFLRACGGGTCDSKEPTSAQLIEASKAKYGVGTPKQAAFETAIDDYGANH